MRKFGLRLAAALETHVLSASRPAAAENDAASAGERSFHMKAFASLPAAATLRTAPSRHRRRSPSRRRRAGRRGGREPPYSIDVPCPWVDFPSGLKRWRFRSRRRGRPSGPPCARVPSWTSTSAPAPGAPANEGRRVGGSAVGLLILVTGLLLVTGRRGVSAAGAGGIGGRRGRVGGRGRGITALRRASPGLRTRRRLHGVATKADDHAAIAEHDLVARLQARLGDPLTVDRRAAGRPEIHHVDLVGPGWPRSPRACGKRSRRRGADGKTPASRS